ncbi:MAG: TIGR00266 family protein [Acidimicrobiia bacterium]
MQSHEIDYQIFGEDVQFVEVELDPGETVIAEAGAMLWMEQGIVFETKLGDGTEPDKGFLGRLAGGAKRMVAGESLFMTHFTNHGGGKQKVAFAAPYPGTIVPLDLGQLGGAIICERDAFLCGALGTKISIEFNRKLGTGFFGGEGFILQRISGDGKAFLHSGGVIVERRLQGETLRVDTGCLVAFEPGITYSIERAGNLKSMVFGGEGAFLATLTGSGRVWLQSLPFSRLADRILAAAPRASGGGGSSVGENVFGNIFER